MPTNVLITGCSSGIGLETALSLKKRGYRVFATARKGCDLSMLQSHGLHAIALDLDRSASIENTILTVCASTQSRIDALVNNAAYGLVGAVEDLSRTELERQFSTNVFGTIELTNQVIAIMRKQGHGRIVFINSILGLVSMGFRGGYCASKFALSALTDALAQELHDTPIQLSTLVPGPIKSQFRHSALCQFQSMQSQLKTSAHRDFYNQMLERVNNTGHNTTFMLPPGRVVKSLLHALEAHRPKRYYHIGLPTHFLASCRRLLPMTVLNMLLRRISRSVS